MKKIITLIITILLLTGCTAKYDIFFDENNIQDTITITTNSSNVNNATKQTTNNFAQKIGEWENGHEYYKRKIITTDKTTAYQYTYSFNPVEYDAMSQIRKCYKDFNLTYKNNIELSTSKEFLCANYYQQVKEYTITISSKYEISSSNADKKEQNKHTWIINNKNYNNKPINIRINKEKKYIEKETKKSPLKKIIILVLFLGLVIFFFKFKKGINN